MEPVRWCVRVAHPLMSGLTWRPFCPLIISIIPGEVTGGSDVLVIVDGLSNSTTVFIAFLVDGFTCTIMVVWLHRMYDYVVRTRIAVGHRISVVKEHYMSSLKGFGERENSLVGLFLHRGKIQRACFAYAFSLTEMFWYIRPCFVFPLRTSYMCIYSTITLEPGQLGWPQLLLIFPLAPIL